MSLSTVFTSESVTQGHPDKICDIVSDAIVDAFQLSQPGSRVAVECAISKSIIFIATHFTGSMEVAIPEIARQVLRECGYANHDFHADECTILTSFVALESMGERSLREEEFVPENLDSIMVFNQVNQFGYACKQSESLMPAPIWFAHELAKKLDQLRDAGDHSFINPDCKTEVGIRYQNGQVASIDNVTLLLTLDPGSEISDQFKESLIEQVIQPVVDLSSLKLESDSRYLINPRGFNLAGGPSFHPGSTGRKTAIDTYGEYARNCSSALSGKDPFRIDRIGAYAARYAAKNIVAAGLARECEVHLAYTFGRSNPESISVETYGTSKKSNQQLTEAISRVFDFRLGAIVNEFNLFNSHKHQLSFKNLACYGQIGREDLGVPWELTDKTEELLENL